MKHIKPKRGREKEVWQGGVTYCSHPGCMEIGHFVVDPVEYNIIRNPLRAVPASELKIDWTGRVYHAATPDLLPKLRGGRIKYLKARWRIYPDGTSFCPKHN